MIQDMDGSFELSYLLKNGCGMLSQQQYLYKCVKKTILFAICGLLSYALSGQNYLVDPGVNAFGLKLEFGAKDHGPFYAIHANYTFNGRTTFDLGYGPNIIVDISDNSTRVVIGGSHLLSKQMTGKSPVSLSLEALLEFNSAYDEDVAWVGSRIFHRFGGKQSGITPNGGLALAKYGDDDGLRGQFMLGFNILIKRTYLEFFFFSDFQNNLEMSLSAGYVWN